MSAVISAGALLLLVACIGLGSIYCLTPYEQTLALENYRFNDEGFYRLTLALTPARYYGLRALLVGGALTGVMLLSWGTCAKSSLTLVLAELRHGTARLLLRWQRLPLSARLLFGGLLFLLFIIRSWYLLRYPLGTDEVASYDYFVHEGLVAITSYYPIPNNHILFNLLAWPFQQAGLSPRFVMRLPTLLWGTIGTGLGYMLLARLTGLRLATLVTGLVGLAPSWVYYAAVGRGYFIEICFVQIGFFAVVELLRPSSCYPRLGWVAFIASSILGFYTIPTYAYPFAGLGLALGGGLLMQRRGRALRVLVAATTVIAVVTLVLYSPVILVTGLQSLVANRYVAAKTLHQFWPPFRAILYETAAELFGPPLRISGPAWLAGTLLGGIAIRRWIPAGPRQTLSFVAWAMLATPIPLMALQRVYAPLRTILYLTFFGYLLLGLGGRYARLRRWIPSRLHWPFIVGAVLLIGSYRLTRHQRQVQASRYETQQLEQSYNWLLQHQNNPKKPLRVWLNSPLHQLFYAHYGIEQPRLLLFSGTKAGPRAQYDFIVTANYYVETTTYWRSAYRPVYHDHLVTIYVAQP